MLTLRKSEDRFHTQIGWLDSWHTFSFADHYHPDHVAFRSLRVINDDKVAAGAGFGMHPHRDMEIVTYVLSGALGHKDSMGNGSMIQPGDVQRMSAGTGVLHSEHNVMKEGQTHLLQIWIMPEERNLKPSYEQKSYSEAERSNTLKLIASRDGREGSVTVHQDVSLYSAILEPGQSVEQPLAPGRHAWVHVAKGAVELNGVAMKAGDGAALSEEQRVQLKGTEPSEVLLFDLA
jgi:redox-sensitive bicupin YhaK (pirin superfamily)